MLQHLLELRRRTLHTLLFFFIFFCVLFYYANELFTLLVGPLLLSLNGQNQLIATRITSPLFTPISLAVDGALLLSTPFALLQLWRFISPGLYSTEKTKLRGLISLSLGLFICGVAFCFYLILPFMFQFFAKAIPSGVHFMPDMVDSIDFITRMLLLFGLSFQVPIVCLVLVSLNLVTLQGLQKARSYVIVAAFIIGMLLTPPDVLSQIMLAIPLWLLYELGILMIYCSNQVKCRTNSRSL